MFAKKVTDDDNFMSLSASAQALYLHLMMSADDDGFSNQVSISMFKAHASVQDLQSLLEKRYIMQFENGVIVITHWRMCNALRSDRHKETIFQEELSKLTLDKNGKYDWLPDGCQVVAERLPQDRIGKDRIGKDRLGQDRTGKDRIDYNAIADAYNRICTSMSKCTKLSDGRKKHIKARLKSFTVEQIELAFSKAEASDFLTGKKGNWKANFDWIIKSDDNLLKILEGKYDNCGSSCPSSGWSFTDL